MANYHHPTPIVLVPLLPKPWRPSPSRTVADLGQSQEISRIPFPNANPRPRKALPSISWI
ncbi:hypothetical protein BGY98DRAFT_1006983, partial [Russula aff. rugulosa BPL654]